LLEAWILNTVNALYCQFEYGCQLFSSSDEVVRLHDVQRFYWSVKALNVSRLLDGYTSELRIMSQLHTGMTSLITQIKNKVDADFAHTQRTLNEVISNDQPPAVSPAVSPIEQQHVKRAPPVVNQLATLAAQQQHQQALLASAIQSQQQQQNAAALAAMQSIAARSHAPKSVVQSHHNGTSSSTNAGLTSLNAVQRALQNQQRIDALMAAERTNNQESIIRAAQLQAQYNAALTQQQQQQQLAQSRRTHRSLEGGYAHAFM
jgi:hypothetical protein